MKVVVEFLLRLALGQKSHSYEATSSILKYCAETYTFLLGIKRILSSKVQGKAHMIRHSC